MLCTTPGVQPPLCLITTAPIAIHYSLLLISITPMSSDLWSELTLGFYLIFLNSSRFLCSHIEAGIPISFVIVNLFICIRRIVT